MVQNLEGTAFLPQQYYNGLQYLTNGPKLMKCQGGMKWMTLTKDHPNHTIRIRLIPNLCASKPPTEV